MGSGEARAPSVLGSISAPGWPVAAVMAGTIHSWASSNTSSRLPWTPFPVTPAGPLPQPLGSTVINIQQLVKVYTLNKDQQWDNQNARHVIQLCGAAEKDMSLLVRAWQNVVHWRREWQTTSIFLFWEPHEQYEKAKRYNTERWAPQVRRCPIYYWGRVEGNY